MGQNITSERLEELQQDSERIEEEIEHLQYEIAFFIKQYQTSRMLGEVVQRGIPDEIINPIEERLYMLVELKKLFSWISESAEREKSWFIQIPPDVPIAERFR